MVLSQAFCKQTLTYYQTTTDSLNDLIRVPRIILLEIQSIIDRFINVLYKKIRDDLKIIEETFLDILTVNDIDQTEGFQALCKDVFACKAFVHSLYTSGLLDLVLDSNLYPDFDDYYADLLPLYDSFELNICSLGLRTTLRNWIYNELEPLITLLDAMDDVLLIIVRNKVGFLINQYDALLSSLNIFALLKLLDEFENCALELCDVKSSASNFQRDYALSYKVSKISNAWQSVMTEYIDDETEPTRLELIQNRDDLKVRITAARNGSLDDTNRNTVAKDQTVTT